MDDFRAKVLSLGGATMPGSRRGRPKVTVQRDGAHSGTTVEHPDGRVDVTIRNPPVTFRKDATCERI